MNNHFFIVGAQRSGTTFLCKICDEHPEIEMAKPLNPEPKFFITDDLYKNGINFYMDHFFRKYIEGKIRGEKSTSYFEKEIAAKRISENFESAKIIIILRDPIERAVSNYLFSYSNGIETLTIDEAFLKESERIDKYDQEKISVSPYAYLKRGLYIDYLEMYEKYFAYEKIHIILFEKMVKDKIFIENFFKFLGVKNNIDSVNIFEKINQNEEISNKEIKDSTYSYLKSYFKDSIIRLQNKLNDPLLEWKTAN